MFRGRPLWGMITMLADVAHLLFSYHQPTQFSCGSKLITKWKLGKAACDFFHFAPQGFLS